MTLFVYFAVLAAILSRNKSVILLPTECAPTKSVKPSRLEFFKCLKYYALEYWMYLVLAILAISVLLFRYPELEYVDSKSKVEYILSQDALQILLGSLFGRLLPPCLNAIRFLTFSNKLEPKSTFPSSVINILSVFAPPVLPLCAALLLWGNVSKVETEGFKVEFATIIQPAQRQLLLDLSDPSFQLKSTLLSVQELDEKIIADEDICKKVYGGSGTNLLGFSIVFQERFIDPFFKEVDHLVNDQKVDVELVRDRTRNLGLVLRKMLLSRKPNDFANLGDNFIQQYAQTMEQLNAIDLEATNSKSFLAGNDNYAASFGTNAISMEMFQDSPYSYIAVAFLCWFNGDEKGSIATLEQGIRLVGDNPIIDGREFNLNMNYQVLLYYSGGKTDSLVDSIEQLDKTVDQVMEDAERVGASSISRDCDKLSSFVQSNLAYFLAQQGKSQVIALEMAYRAYNKFPTNPYLIDNYAYVLMATASRKLPADFDTIERARGLLEEASYFNRNIGNEVNRAANDVVVNNHLRQAELLLLQRK